MSWPSDRVFAIYRSIRAASGLVDVDDDTLVDVKSRLHDLARDLARYGNQPAGEVVLALAWAVHDVHVDRQDAEEHLRVQLDANGHEVDVFFDGTADRLDGAGWWTACTCDGMMIDPGYMATRGEAVEVGGRHVIETGGAWAEGMSQP